MEKSTNLFMEAIVSSNANSLVTEGCRTISLALAMLTSL